MVHCEGSGGGAASTGATATGSGAATVPVASNLRLVQRDQPLVLLWGHSLNMHVLHHFRTPVGAGPSIHPAASTWQLSHFLGIVGTRGGGGGGAPFLKRCAPFYLFFAPSYWFCAPPKGKFPWKIAFGGSFSQARPHHHLSFTHEAVHFSSQNTPMAREPGKRSTNFPGCREPCRRPVILSGLGSANCTSGQLEATGNLR